LELLDDLERFGRKLDTLTDSIRFADYGYTGFFDAIKIKEDELDRLYEYDAAFAGRIGEVASALNGLLSATVEAMLGQLRAATELVAALEDQWKDREKVMFRLVENAGASARGLLEEGVQ
jgi:hypothetical protein